MEWITLFRPLHLPFHGAMAPRRPLLSGDGVCLEAELHSMGEWGVRLSE